MSVKGGEMERKKRIREKLEKERRLPKNISENKITDQASSKSISISEKRASHLQSSLTPKARHCLSCIVKMYVGSVGEDGE